MELPGHNQLILSDATLRMLLEEALNYHMHGCPPGMMPARGPIRVKHFNVYSQLDSHESWSIIVTTDPETP